MPRPPSCHRRAASTRRAALLLVLAAGALAPFGRERFAAADTPSCRAEWLSMRLDAENGAFNGMSHAGTLLVLRNIGAAACRIGTYPRTGFKDGHDRPLPTVGQAPDGPSPGPARRTVRIAAGAEATATLRWIAGDVFEDGICYRPAAVSLNVGQGSLQRAFSGRLCAPRWQPATFTQGPLTVGPVPPS